MSTNRGMKRQMDEPKATTSKIGSNSAKRNYKRLSKKQLLGLKKWFEDHKDHPYPKNENKIRLATEANLTFDQVTKWFINERSKQKAKLMEESGQPHNILLNHESCKNESKWIKKKFQRFPEKSLRVLHNWFEDHKDHPYPKFEERQRLATEANLTLDQVRVWFQHERNRYKAKLKKEGGPPRNIRVEGVKEEENKENPLVRTNPLERTNSPRDQEKDEQEPTTSKNEWYWLETKAKRLPESSVRVLEKWYEDHKQNSEPSEEEKVRLATEANLTLTQVRSWFQHKRRKYDKKLLKKESDHPQNIQIEGVKEEEEDNKENTMVTIIPIEREANVVPLNEVATIIQRCCVITRN